MQFLRVKNLSSKSICTWGIILFLLTIALVARISNLDKKFYWIDEVSSSYVITGNWPEQIEDEVNKISGQIITIGQVQNVLEQRPSSDSSQLVSSLLKRDPQHSPLYFLIVQKWAAIFGAKPESLRMASSLLSFAGVAIFAWLCVELFGSLYFAIIGLCILALAPFHILFSQQNREYGMWFAVCAFSTALLLLANRKNNKMYWAAYGFSVAVSLYTFLFSLPFLGSHFLFQWFERKSSLNSGHRFKKFLVAFVIGVVSFAPWAINILLNVKQVQNLNKWSSMYLEPKLYLQSLILNFSRLLLDVNLPSFKPLPWDQPLLLISILVVVAIIIVSLIFSVRRLTFSKSILLISMFAIPFLFLFSMDVLAGQGIHALVSRQLMPAWLSVYLVVTYTIGIGLNSKSFTKKTLALTGVTVILISEVLFSITYIPQRHWWPLKPESLFQEAIAIEQANPDLLIVSQPVEVKQFLSLSYTLNRNLSLLFLQDDQQIPSIKNESKFALYQPSEGLVKILKAKFILEKISDNVWMGRSK